MSTQKLMLPILAAIVGVAASAFTVSHHSGQPFETANYWYEYTGAQNATDRTLNSNYENPQMDSFSCSGVINECSVLAEVTLDAQGNPPDHPDFTGASFQSQGFPEPGTGSIEDNQLKQ